MSSHNNFDGFSDGFSTHSDDGLPVYTVGDGYYDTYEMPTATLVEEEGVIVPEKLEEDNDLVVVDAEVGLGLFVFIVDVFIYGWCICGGVVVVE